MVLRSLLQRLGSRPMVAFALVSSLIVPVPPTPVNGQPATSQVAPPIAGRSIEAVLDQDGYLSNPEGSYAVDGWRMEVMPDGRPRFRASDHTVAESPHLASASTGDDSNWSSEFALGGVDGDVNAIACNATVCYVGGNFRVAGGVLANRIAKLDLVSNSWSALGFGLSSQVKAIALDLARNKVYVGGTFFGECTNADCSTKSTTGGVNLIAVWNTTSNSWSGLANGLAAFDVQSIVVNAAGTQLWAGGYFTARCDDPGCVGRTGDLGMDYVARYDINAGTWHRLGFGLNDQVHALALSGDGTKLYAGGKFYRRCVDLPCTMGLQQAAGVNRIAVYSNPTQEGNQWTELSNGLIHTLFAFGSNISTIAVAGDDLYVGGTIDRQCSNDSCGGTEPDSGLDFIAWYSAEFNTWFPVVKGLNNAVRAIAYDPAGNRLIIGGEFTGVCTVIDGCSSDPNEPNNRVIQYNLGLLTWSSLALGVNGDVRAIAMAGNTPVIAGQFNAVCLDDGCLNFGADPAAHIARFSGGGWLLPGGAGSSPVTGQHDSNDGAYLQINALLAVGEDVYVGGNFRSVAGIPVNGVARWNRANNQWFALGFGLVNRTGWVQALAYFNGKVVAGGAFSGACADIQCTFRVNIGQNYLAQFDGSWQPLLFGVDSPVNALTVSGSSLVIGGEFTRRCTGANPCNADAVNRLNRIVSWNGTAYAPLGNGLDSEVHTVGTFNGSIYAGGDFTKRCDSQDCAATSNGFNRIARFDGSLWQPVGFGLNGRVQTIVSFTGELVAGGTFFKRCLNTICDQSEAAGVNGIARFDGTAWQPLGFGLKAGIGTGRVNHLLVVQGHLIATGNLSGVCTNADCTNATGAAANLFRFASSTGIWVSLGSGLNNTGNALALSGGSLMVGGEFSAAGLKSAGRIARFSELADLSVSASDAPDPASFGAQISYSVVVSNSGPGTATGVVVTATLPSNILVSSAAIPGGTCSGTGPVVCTLASLAPGSAIATIVVTPIASGTYQAAFAVSTASVDWSNSNESILVLTKVLPVVVIPAASVGRGIS